MAGLYALLVPDSPAPAAPALLASAAWPQPQLLAGGRSVAPDSATLRGESGREPARWAARSAMFISLLRRFSAYAARQHVGHNSECTDGWTHVQACLQFWESRQAD